jgi:signal transduction histidine kinase
MTPVEAARAERRLALAHELTSRALEGDTEALWPAVAHALLAHFGCERATVFQRGEDGALRSRYAHGLGRELRLPAGHGVAGAAADAGRPVLVNDAYEDARFERAADRQTGFSTRQVLAFPLLYRGRCVGVVELLNKDGGFSPADLEDAAWLADGLSVIFAKAAAEEERAELAKRILHVEKMAALGRMAGGIAHEVNNPLTAILGLSSVLMRRPDTSPESLPTLLKIDAEVRRIQKLVTDLLGFSRGTPPALGPVDLRQVARETLELAAPELKRRRVAGELEAPEDLPAALGDAHALKQVLLNLLLNAAYALEGRAGATARVTLSARGGRLAVGVVDNGPGVPADLADRIFEPFFTTKPEGQGTGLGLYVSAEIVRRHGGRLVCEPAPGGGAAFRFELPLAPALPAADTR